MENNPRLALQLAFQHLDTFSVPGVGTFKKSRFPAEIDSESGTIKPPYAKFVHASSEKHVAELESFYQSHFKLDESKTKEMVSEVKLWLMRGLKGGGRIQLEGVGTMELTGGKVLKFEPEASLEGQSADFFGLQPVDMGGEQKGKNEGKGALAAAAGLAAGIGAIAASGGGESKKTETPKAKEKSEAEKRPESKEKAEEKPKVAAKPQTEAKKTEEKPKAKSETEKSQPNLKKKEKVAAVAAVAAPTVAPPVSQAPAEEKKKRKGMGWLVLALLLIGIAVAGFVWKDDVNRQLTKWGVIGGGGGPEGPEGPLTDNDGNEVSADSSSTALDNTEPLDSIYEEDLVITNGDYPEDDNSTEPVENDPSVGSFAAAGQFYLIVGSTHNSDDALRLARQVGGKIIKPRYEGNYYRIYTAKASNKDDVIAQMVASKEKHPKSWIFWLGM